MKMNTFSLSSKKEVSKMKTLKKTLIVGITLLSFLANVVPVAHAYTPLKTPVTISASGTLGGVTIAFSADEVAQGTGTALSAIAFTSPAGIADSGAAIKIKGGTNEVNSRVIIYTENNLNTAAPEKAPTVDPATGIDGGGMVGRTEPGYCVSLFWGADTTANNSPNTNVDYVFGNPQTPVEGGSGNCTFIVDKRHTHSFTGTSNAPYASNPAPFNTAVGMDSNAMYTLAGAVVANPASAAGKPGLYPQAWDQDYYDKINTDPSRKVVSPALYKTIATVMFGISTGADTDAGYYIGNMGQLRTLATDDSITARLSKTDGTVGGELYIAIGGDFNGKPAQTYSTAKLNVAIVQD